MVGLFSIAVWRCLRAWRAQGFGMEVAGQNIANVNAKASRAVRRNLPSARRRMAWAALKSSACARRAMRSSTRACETNCRRSLSTAPAQRARSLRPRSVPSGRQSTARCRRCSSRSPTRPQSAVSRLSRRCRAERESSGELDQRTGKSFASSAQQADSDVRPRRAANQHAVVADRPAQSAHWRRQRWRRCLGVEAISSARRCRARRSSPGSPSSRSRRAPSMSASGQDGSWSSAPRTTHCRSATLQ